MAAASKIASTPKPGSKRPRPDGTPETMREKGGSLRLPLPPTADTFVLTPSTANSGPKNPPAKEEDPFLRAIREQKARSDAQCEVLTAFRLAILAQKRTFDSKSPAHSEFAATLTERMATVFHEASCLGAVLSTPPSSPKASVASAASARSPPAPSPPTYAGIIKSGPATTAPAAPQKKLASRSTQSPGQKGSQPSPEKQDPRIFLRLLDPSKWSQDDSYKVRQFAAQATKRQVSDFPSATKIDTGFAITPRTKDDGAALLLAADALGALIPGHFRCVEQPVKWYKYILDGLPATARDMEGNPLSAKPAVMQEAAVQTSKIPIDAKPASSTQPHDHMHSWVIAFLEPVPQFRLFGVTKRSRLLEKTNPPKQCPHCFDWHGRTPCERRTYCAECALPEHGPCSTQPPKCINCLGPHRADSPECPMRPKKFDGRYVRPSPLQRKEIRAEGKRNYDFALKRVRSQAPEWNGISDGEQPRTTSQQRAEATSTPSYDSATSVPGNETSDSDRGQASGAPPRRPSQPAGEVDVQMVDLSATEQEELLQRQMADDSADSDYRPTRSSSAGRPNKESSQPKTANPQPAPQPASSQRSRAARSRNRASTSSASGRL